MKQCSWNLPLTEGLELHGQATCTKRNKPLPRSDTPGGLLDSPHVTQASHAKSVSVCVASNDPVWAQLLSQNLTARGATAVQCTMDEVKQWASAIESGSWVIVDGGWPDSGLHEATSGLDAAIRSSGARTVMVVDRLVEAIAEPAFSPDRVVNRTPDMRVLVRDLLSAFASGLPDPTS